MSKRAIIEVTINTKKPHDDTLWRYYPATLLDIANAVFQKGRKNWDYSFTATKISIIEEESEA